MHAREQLLLERLDECRRRRETLLADAVEEGFAARDLRALTKALPHPERSRLSPQMNKAASQSRLLQHHSLANWVLAQRTLLHLSQMLEIIATGGRLKPTYGERGVVHSSGLLVDHAA